MLPLIRQSLKPALRFLPFLLKTSWWWILAFHVLCFSFADFFQSLAVLHQQDSQMVIMSRLGELMAALTLSLFFALIIPSRWDEWRKAEQQRSLGFLLKKYTVPLTLESLRAFVKMLLWTLLLILPGIFQYWRLTLVPYIVILNPNYDEGRLDALKHSHDLIRGKDLGWVLFLLVLVTIESSYFLLGLIPGFPSDFSLQLLISLLTLPLTLYSYSVLVEVYSRLEESLQISQTKES